VTSLDVRSGARQRPAGVVVGRRVGRRVRDDDTHAEYASRVLIRSWNLFHGRTVPSGRKRYFERMVKLICQDGPAIVALQELAAGTLFRLEAWSGYAAYGDVAAPARLPRNLGGLVTDLDPTRLRSAVEGQAKRSCRTRPRVTDHRRSCSTRTASGARIAEELGLGLVTRLRWARERRMCQALRSGRRPTAVVGNLHATASATRASRTPNSSAAASRRRPQSRRASCWRGDFNAHGGDVARCARSAPQVGVLAGRPRARRVLVRALMPQAPSGTGRKTSATRRRPLVGSCARGARGPMTFAEGARPVSGARRYAYLNAGTFGPMSSAVADAIAAEQQRTLREGRFNRAAFSSIPEDRPRCARVRGADRRAGQRASRSDLDVRRAATSS
jgi:hypothetical protein